MTPRDQPAPDHAQPDAHHHHVEGGFPSPHPTPDPPMSDAQTGRVRGEGAATNQPGPDQDSFDDHAPRVGAGSFAPPPAARDQNSNDDQRWTVAARVEEYNLRNLPVLCLAENLHDIEGARIAMANRLRSLAGLDVGQADIPRLEALVAGITDLEHRGTLDLERAMRAHPLAPWVARSRGVGLKQAARLLAAIGNPYWNELHQRPRRGPAELWAYCGYDVRQRTSGAQDANADNASPAGQNRPDPPCATAAGEAPRRRKGQRANWNTHARTRAYLIAESCMKASGGDYRAVYDHGRTKYADLPKGHAHNRALRLVAKAVLRDIWIEARDWHHAP